MPLKIHLLISSIFAIAFVVIVQLFATPLPVFRFLGPAYMGYIAAVMLYNRWYMISTERFSIWVWLRIPLFLLAWFGVFFLIPATATRGVFLLISVPIIFFFESLVGHSGQQLGWNEFLLTLATMLLSLFGLSYYFILPGVVYLLIVFVSITALVRTSVEFVPHAAVVKWIAALAIGLFATELFWAINFLPLHYSALAIIVFNIVYVVWIVYYHYLYHTLTWKQVQFHMVLALILTVVVFLSTPWSIQT